MPAEILPDLAFAGTGFIGGFIAVPIGGSLLLLTPLWILLGLEGIEILMLSRFYIVGTGLSSTAYFARHGGFDLKKIWPYALGCIAGFFVAAILATSFDPANLTKIILWVMLAGSALLVFDWKLTGKSRQLFAKTLPLFGFAVGGYNGIGGGAGARLHTLAFTLGFGWDIHRAIRNNRLISVVNNLFGGIFLLAAGGSLTGHELPVVLGALAGGWVGAHVTLRSKPKFLKWGFLALVAAMAVKTTFF